jgi:hypothetical protein
MAVTVSVVFYLSRKWPIPGPFSALLLGAHFIFWAWAAGTFGNSLSIIRPYNPWNLSSWIPALEAFMLPVLGFFWCLTWGMQVKSSTTGIA